MHKPNFSTSSFKSCNKEKNKTSKSNNNNPWYDNECLNKRKEFKNARDIYNVTLQEEDLKTLCKIRNSYRQLCRRKRKEFNFRAAKDLVHLSKTNSKQFWKKIKRKLKKKENSCDFHTYFKNLFETPITVFSAETHQILNDDYLVQVLEIFF